jgi:4-hydroxy-tetrahydrodipicolinate synthase
LETVVRLAKECSNIVGIKEAGGSPDRVSQIRQALGAKFDILSGDDSLTLPFMAVGADGVVSVASNVIPKEVAQMVKAFAAGDSRRALKAHAKYFPLFRTLFIETNPAPVKAAMAMQGVIEEAYRLPMVRMEKKNRDILERTLRDCGALK